MRAMDEAVVIDKVERDAERYFRKYRPFVEQLENNLLLKRFKPITAWDVRALGKMLENVDDMVKMCENAGTVADLGPLPRIAKDVVTIMYGTSPLPLISSVQPMDEEIGLVYYKQVMAISSGGNLHSGDIIVSPLGDYKTPQGYANAEVTETVGTGNGTVTTFTATTTYHPVRPGTVSITAGGATAVDSNYDGNLIGQGVSGTINYQTGAVSLTFATAPASGITVAITYWGNVEDINLGVKEINYELTAQQIRAKIYALKGMTGLFKNWQLQKRFGVSAEEELASDLVNAVNAEILGNMITKMNAKLPGTATWDATVPTNTSYFEHKQSFKDTLSYAESQMVANAKRGVISFILAGTKVASVIRTLFGWEQIYDGKGMFTAHLFGQLDGIPVIRVVDANILPPTSAIIGYKGVSEFEAPAVYAPYMPVTVTSVLPTINPLVTQRAVASWAGVEVLVNNFLYGVNITGSLPGQ